MTTSDQSISSACDEIEQAITPSKVYYDHYGSKTKAKQGNMTQHNYRLFKDDMENCRHYKDPTLGGASLQDRIDSLGAQAAGKLDRDREKRGLPWNNQIERDTGRPAMGAMSSSIEMISSWIKSLILTDNLDSLIEIRPTHHIEMGDCIREDVTEALTKIVDKKNRDIFDNEVRKMVAELAAREFDLSEEAAAEIVALEEQNREESIFCSEDEVDAIAENLLIDEARKEKDKARQRARELTNIARDTLNRSKSFKQILRYLVYVFIYPYAVIGYRYIDAPRRKYEKSKNGKRKLITKKETTPQLWAPDPRDVFFTADGEDFLCVTSFIIRHHMRFHDIHKMLNNDGSKTRKKNIKEVLDLPSSRLFHRDDIMAKLDDGFGFTRTTESDKARWHSMPSQKLEVFEQWTVVTKEQLNDMPDWKDYFDSKPKYTEPQYRLVTYYAAGKPIWVEVLPMCDENVRYRKYSFKECPGEFAGTGFAEVLRPIDAVMRKITDLIVRHINDLINPPKLISAKVSMEDIGPFGLQPGKNYTVKDTQSTQEGIKIIEKKNHLASLIGLYQHFEDKIQAQTGINPLAVGLTTGIGSQFRTRGQQEQLVDSSLKTVTTRTFEAFCEIAELEEGLLYPYLMDHPEYEDLIQGDAEVRVFGIQNKLFNEKKLRTLEIGLQYALGSDLVDRKEAKALLYEYFQESGINIKTPDNAENVLRDVSGAVQSAQPLSDADALQQITAIVGEEQAQQIAGVLGGLSEAA